ncbi:unnamed protein product [Sphagnum jensenii]|uniref:Carboxypeptidase n=1 Tax=Sphagnum jensenii TaxID=128206 RepID=A0ABP1BM95_9BRYO
MTPPPYVLSQGVLATIGNALLHAFAIGIGAFHEASNPHHEARPCLPSVKQQSKAQRPTDRVWELPGAPANVNFTQYAGYVTVRAGRELFYFFVESPQDAASKPLILWLNGGPGCSSLAFGFSEEIGPYRIYPNASSLYLNPYAWNLAANVIFLESPTGVGFSYSNISSENESSGDARTAQENYSFLLNWLERFPAYKSREFYIAGESYAGHYIPELAKAIVDGNKEASSLKINLKGFMAGNPVTDGYWDNVGVIDYYWTHAMISDHTYHQLKKLCNFSDPNCCSNSCNNVYNYATNTEIGNIDPYSINTPACTETVGGGSPQKKKFLSFRPNNPFLRGKPMGYDPCTENYAEIYYNRPDVQKALHANISGIIPYNWTGCSNLLQNWTDSPFSMLPLYRELIAAGLRIWVYSGDADSVVPVTSTRYSLDALKLPIVVPWYAWYHHQQVGGRVQGYKGLTFITIRGAGHEVPLLQHSRFLQMLRVFLADKSLPATPYV